MTLDEFTGIVTELSDFYERKQPKINTIELWYRSIKRIPSEPVKWIARHIEDNYESFPKNIVSALWGGYTEWQQAHPDKAARESFFHCADCCCDRDFVRTYLVPKPTRLGSTFRQLSSRHRDS